MDTLLGLTLATLQQMPHLFNVAAGLLVTAFMAVMVLVEDI